MKVYQKVYGNHGGGGRAGAVSLENTERAAVIHDGFNLPPMLTQFPFPKLHRSPQSFGTASVVVDVVVACVVVVVDVVVVVVDVVSSVAGALQSVYPCAQVPSAV